MILCEQNLQLCRIDTSDGMVMRFNAEGDVSEQHFDFVTLDKVNGYQTGGGNSLVANEFIKYLDVAEYRGFDSAVRYGRYLNI